MGITVPRRGNPKRIKCSRKGEAEGIQKSPATRVIVGQKKYKDATYSARALAEDLETNTRYLSAVINSRFGMNYSCLVNEYRIKEAMNLLVDKRYAAKNIEEISTMVGFSNRQSFYAAFYRIVGMTPKEYRDSKMKK